MPGKPLYVNTVRAVLLAALLSALQLTGQTQQKAPGPDKPGTGAATHGDARPGASGPVIQIKKQLTGEFTYRFVTPTEQNSAPVPLPTPTTPDGPIAVTLPASLTQSKAILEVVDKTRGNVARIPLADAKSEPVTLTEASFKYIQTIYVTVQHSGKGVTDAFVTIADAPHKFSMAWLLKPSDNGVAQFSNVPMGEPITVAVNAASHNPTSVTNTLLPGHPADGYHWPTISVDWPDAVTVAPPPVAAAPATGAAPGATHEDRSGDSTTSDKREQGGGLFSSLINVVLSLAVLGGIIYLAIWAFNQGHVKTLLDRAGINTAELPAGGGAQPSPFDKPARPPISPITEGTADPFVGGVAMGSPASPGFVSGPRLVATVGAYSGTIFQLAPGSADIGRDPANAVPLPNDTNTSRRHATLNVSAGQFTVTDNASSNGTFLNGVRIPGNAPQPLRSGDEIQVGQTRFRFEA